MVFSVLFVGINDMYWADLLKLCKNQIVVTKLPQQGADFKSQVQMLIWLGLSSFFFK